MRRRRRPESPRRRAALGDAGGDGSSLPESDTTIRTGIPVTTPARTLKDLRRVVAAHVYRQALRQAEYLGLPLGDISTDRTRSELERDFLRLCRRFHLREPEINVRVGPYTVDFLWPERRLVVETDGYAAHGGRQAFEDDRERELALHERGYHVRRFTARQLRERPQNIIASLRPLL